MMTVMPGASRLLQPNTVRNLQDAAIPVSTAELSHAPYITTSDGVASIMLSLIFRKMEVRGFRIHAAGDPEGRRDGNSSAALALLRSLRRSSFAHPMKSMISCKYRTRPAHEEASNFCLSENGIVCVDRSDTFRKSALLVLAGRILSGNQHCWCWQVGYFQEISIAGVDNLGTFRKSALLSSTFAPVKISGFYTELLISENWHCRFVM